MSREATHMRKGRVLSREVEWLERGWPLGPDGRCEKSGANEVGRVGESAAFDRLSPRLFREVFAANGGQWNAFGSTSPLKPPWPQELPGCLVLKTVEELRGELGRDLVLGLVEKRYDDSQRPYTRCVWYVLPQTWSKQLEPREIGGACEELLAHRSARGRNAARIELPQPGTHLRAASLVGEQVLRTEYPATPAELMMGLVKEALRNDRERREKLSEALRKGLAVFCAPSNAKSYALAIAAGSSQLSSRWRHPIPMAESPPLRSRADSVEVESERSTSRRQLSARHEEGPSAHHMQLSSASRGRYSERSEVDEMPRVERGHRSISVLLMLALLALQLVNLIILGLLVGREVEQAEPVAVRAPSRQTQPTEPPQVTGAVAHLSPVIRRGRLVALEIEADELDELGALTTADRRLLDQLRGYSHESLSLVAFARDHDCDQARQVASDALERIDRLLGMSYPMRQKIVIGMSTEHTRASAPFDLLDAGVMIVLGREGDEWRRVDRGCGMTEESRP